MSHKYAKTIEFAEAAVVSFENRLGVDVHLFWLDFNQHEIPSGIIGAFSDITTNTYGGHAFRMRSASGALLKEHVVLPKNRPSSAPVVVEPCGDYSAVRPTITYFYRHPIIL